MDTFEAIIIGLSIGVFGTAFVVTMLSAGTLAVDGRVVFRDLNQNEITFWTDFIKANPDLPKYVECDQIPKIVIEPKEVKKEIVIPIGNVKGCE
jgi:hypothetical protein